MSATRYASKLVWSSTVLLGLAVILGVIQGETAERGREPAANEAAAAPVGKSGKDSGGKKREIKVQAGHWQYDNKRMLHILTPSDKVKQVTIREVGEDYQMVADRVEYDDRNDTANGSGNLHFTDVDTTIVGDLVVVNFDEKRAVLTGNVTLTSHGEETTDEDEEELPLKDRYRKKRTVVNCDQLDYWYKEKRAVATGNLRFKQGDRHGTAGTATYLEKDDILLLEGAVQVTNKKGEIAKAPQVTIDNKQDTMAADQGVEITFFVEEEEDEESGGKSSGKAKTESKKAGKAGGKTEAGKGSKGSTTSDKKEEPAPAPAAKESGKNNGAGGSEKPPLAE